MVKSIYRRGRRYFHRRGFNPDAYGPGSLFLESSRITGVAAGANLPAAGWLDFSGSGKHAQNGGGGPTYEMFGQNSKPFVLFDGSTDLLSLASALSLAGAYTFCVVSSTTAEASLDPWLGRASTTASGFIHARSNTTVRTTTNAQANRVHAARGTATHVDIVRRESDDEISHWMDGAKSTGTGTSVGTWIPDTIGSIGGSAYFGGRMYDLYIWSLAIIDAKILEIDYAKRAYYALP